MRLTQRFSMLTAALLTMLMLSLSVQAEQKVVANGYEVHYSAIPSSFLTPEVAADYGLTRSRVMGLLNIAVLKLNADGSTTPVTAIVSGSAKNLVQQVKPLEFQKVTEGRAIYYISTFRFSNEENLNFDLNVQPNPNESAINVRFSQTFYEG